MRSGITAVGIVVPTPLANANAAAEWPDGNDVDTGIRTWRSGGPRWAVRFGPRRRLSGLTAKLTMVAVTATEASPRAAARRPAGPHARASTVPEASESRE